MEKEHRRDILLISSNDFLLNGFILNCLSVCEIAVMFLFVMWPLEPISNGVFSTIHPLFFMSLVKSLYLIDFCMLAESIFFSKLTVNSKSVIFFSARLIKTISGLCPVATMSADPNNTLHYTILICSKCVV